MKALTRNALLAAPLHCYWPRAPRSWRFRLAVSRRFYDRVLLHVRRPPGGSPVTEDPGIETPGARSSGCLAGCGWTLVLRARTLGAGPLRTPTRASLPSLLWGGLFFVGSSSWFTPCCKPPASPTFTAASCGGGKLRPCARPPPALSTCCSAVARPGSSCRESISTLMSSFGNIRTYVNGFLQTTPPPAGACFRCLPSANVSRTSSGIGNPPGLER